MIPDWQMKSTYALLTKFPASIQQPQSEIRSVRAEAELVMRVKVNFLDEAFLGVAPLQR